MKIEKFKTTWLVQLVELNDFHADLNFNILPLGSYNVLICMTQLEKQGVVINFLQTIVSCISEDVKNQ